MQRTPQSGVLFQLATIVPKTSAFYFSYYERHSDGTYLSSLAFSQLQETPADPLVGTKSNVTVAVSASTEISIVPASHAIVVRPIVSSVTPEHSSAAPVAKFSDTVALAPDATVSPSETLARTV